jgi:hypothetical protein
MKSSSELTDEIGILLTGARRELTGLQREKVAALVTKNLDWYWLLNTGRQHGVLPLLWSHLSPHHSRIPADTLQDFTSYLRHNAASCLRITNELLQLSKLFSDNGVPMIAFKGPVLSLRLYGSCCQRQYGDLDLLIAEEDLERTTSLLQCSGYDLLLTPAQQRYYRKRRYHFAFVHQGTNASVEIHWAFTPQYWPFPLNGQRLWNRKSTFEYQGHRLTGLSPEYRLLVLCAHGCKERWARLQLVADIHATIEQGIDWDIVLREAESIGRQRILFLGLALAADLLGTRLPPDIRRQINQEHAVENVVSSLRNSLFDPSRWPLRGVQLHRYFFQVWPRRRDRLGYVEDQLRRIPQKIRQLAAPAPTDRRVLRFPRQLSFAYYLIRPLRLALHYRSPRRMVAALLKHF